MNVTILLYDDFTALDAVGAYEVLRLLPGARVQFVAKTAGIQRSDARSLGLIAERDLASVTATDVLVVPGGPGQLMAERDPATTGWVARIHATWRRRFSLALNTIRSRRSTPARLAKLPVTSPRWCARCSSS
jgi:putative intracellular protease/amidase